MKPFCGKNPPGVPGSAVDFQEKIRLKIQAGGGEREGCRLLLLPKMGKPRAEETQSPEGAASPGTRELLAEAWAPAMGPGKLRPHVARTWCGARLGAPEQKSGSRSRRAEWKATAVPGESPLAEQHLKYRAISGPTGALLSPRAGGPGDPVLPVPETTARPPPCGQCTPFNSSLSSWGWGQTPGVHSPSSLEQV